MNNNECILKEINVDLCNIIDADEGRPHKSLRALCKALICQVIVFTFLFWTVVLACWVTPGGSCGHEINLSESKEIWLSFVTWHTGSYTARSFRKGFQLRFVAFIYGHDRNQQQCLFLCSEL